MAKAIVDAPNGVLEVDGRARPTAWSNIGGWTASLDGGFALDYMLLAPTTEKLEGWSVKADDTVRAQLGVTNAEHKVTSPR